VHDDARTRHGELEAFAAHGLDQDGELQFAAAGDVERVLVFGFFDLQRDVAFGFLEQAVADDAEVTLSPSVPASGLSLTMKDMVTVGGSIGCAVSGLR
jgi:hypothetical protein